MAGFFAEIRATDHTDNTDRVYEMASSLAARRPDVPLVLMPNHATKASGMPVPRRDCSTGYADWMFGRGMKVFAAE
jgi:hypothetical protein